MKIYILTLAGALMLAGCVTQSGSYIPSKIEKEKLSGWTRYSRMDSDGNVESYSLNVNDKTGEVRWENEPPTLSQFAHYADEIYTQVVLPKLKRGEALDEDELAVLACCLNVRISRMNAMNTMILDSMQLSHQGALTYGMVAHPKIDQLTDFGSERTRKEAERKRNASEKAFKDMLGELVDKDIKSDSEFHCSVQKWGESFSGNESVTLDKSVRERILRQILTDEDWDYRYLKKGFWYTLFSVLFWNPNTHKQPLPEYEKQYTQRNAHIVWREEFQEDRELVARMYDSLCRAGKENSRKEKDIRRARLSNLQEEFSDRAKAVDKANLLVYDYPFAVTLLECMRMMDYYDRNEWCNVTLNEVKEKRYKPLARCLVRYASTLRMDKIGHAGLRRLYEKVYVPFLGNAFDMTSQELYSSGLIPFSVDAEFDLQLIKSNITKENGQSAMQTLLKEGL